MTHPEFATQTEAQELIDPQTNLDDMPEEFGGLPQRTEVDKEIGQRIQVIMALRARILFLEQLVSDLKRGNYDNSIEERGIADCKAVLDSMNAPHYEG